MTKYFKQNGLKRYLNLMYYLFICILEKKDGGMNWIDLAQDTYRWWAVVNAVMNLWVA